MLIRTKTIDEVILKVIDTETRYKMGDKPKLKEIGEGNTSFSNFSKVTITGHAKQKWRTRVRSLDTTLDIVKGLNTILLDQLHRYTLTDDWTIIIDDDIHLKITHEVPDNEICIVTVYGRESLNPLLESTSLPTSLWARSKGKIPLEISKDILDNEEQLPIPTKIVKWCEVNLNCSLEIYERKEGLPYLVYVEEYNKNYKRFHIKEPTERKGHGSIPLIMHKLGYKGWVKKHILTYPQYGLEQLVEFYKSKKR